MSLSSASDKEYGEAKEETIPFEPWAPKENSLYCVLWTSS